MVRFGIWTEEQYRELGEKRRYSGGRVAFNLSLLPENPSPDQVRMFDDISLTLQTNNGVFRTTFRNRFADVDQATSEWLAKHYAPETELTGEDRAVSHGLTSAEWVGRLREQFPRARVAASDILLELYELRTPDGDVFVVEPSSEPLQYIRPPFVVTLRNRENRRYPINHLVAAYGRRRFARLRLPADFLQSPPAGFVVRPISCIHPEARATEKTGALSFSVLSVFDVSSSPVHVLRTMNILNRSYFSDEQLRAGIETIRRSLRPGGLWVVGRTMEHDFRNHVTFYEHTGGGWRIAHRIGDGSEVEPLVVVS